MIYKRHCILTLRQRARASTGPDTLFDAYEATASNLAQALALACGSLLATARACIVRSFSRRSRRYAARAQTCTSERDLATLPIRYSARRMRMRARHRKQKHVRRQSRLALRASRTRSQAQDDAGPAQRSRGRKLEATAPQPAPLENALRTG